MGWWNDRRPAVKVEKDNDGNIVLDENNEPVTSQVMEDVPVKKLEELTLKDLELEFPARVYTDSKGYRYRILRTNRFSSDGKGGRRYYNTGLAIIKEIPVERQVQVQAKDEDGNLLTNDNGDPKMITVAKPVDNLVCNPMQEQARQQS